MKEESYTVVECSSFQLETIVDFRPDVSAILNITEDHLNRHKTMDHYAAIKERKAQFSTEIDVRGERVTDALEIVMKYVDDALMLGVPSVRILHGKGTGALREEIQKYLRTVPGVVSAADEHVQFGGSGVTVVKFE